MFFTPNPFPILAIHSHLQQYMLRTLDRKENIVAHKMLVVFFSRKVLDAGKLLLLEDLEYQVGAKRQHKHLICIYKHGVQGSAREEVYYNPFTLQI